MSESISEHPTAQRSVGRQGLGRRPTPEYLMDANYYRLAYQLLAQQANRAASSKAVQDTGQSSAQTAERLLGDLDTVLRWLEQRQLQSRYPWRRGLTVPDERLQLFLAGTVEPCTLLIVAARAENLSADPLEFIGFAAGRRFTVRFTGIAREPHPTEIPWSYRAYYNLACCYAAGVAALVANTSHGGDPSDSQIQSRVTGGLRALEQAFRQVHGRARTELWRWAKRDPSLHVLTDQQIAGELFASLLTDYAPPVAKPASRS